MTGSVVNWSSPKATSACPWNTLETHLTDWQPVGTWALVSWDLFPKVFTRNMASFLASIWAYTYKPTLINNSDSPVHLVLLDYFVGKSHSVAVGDTMVFGCQSKFEFLDKDELTQTFIHLPCTSDGSFAVPETWPSCVPSRCCLYQSERCIIFCMTWTVYFLPCISLHIFIWHKLYFWSRISLFNDMSCILLGRSKLHQENLCTPRHCESEYLSPINYEICLPMWPYQLGFGYSKTFLTFLRK